MKFKILGSSSGGNCSFLETQQGKFLIDAGFSGKQIAQRLEAIGECVEAIDAVFVTHEHQDHIQGLAGLTRYCPGLTLVANHKTAQALGPRLKRPVNWAFFETGKVFDFRGVGVWPLPLPHDASDPVGFVFDVKKENHKLAWITDLGGIPGWLPKIIQKIDTLVLESNYEEKLLLEDMRRPWSVKQRIFGPRGHLSNEVAINLLTSLCGQSNWKAVHLAHLSQHCNDPFLLKSQLEIAGLLTQKFCTHIVRPG